MSVRASEPHYVRVSQVLRERLTQEDYSSLLPSEAALQNEFKVSRSVIRQAIDLLVAEGLVTKEKGRGTVVLNTRPHHRVIHSLNGIGRSSSKMDAGTTTEVLSVEEVNVAEPLLSWKNNKAARIRRVRSIRGHKVAYIETLLPEDIGRKLSAKELTDVSLHGVLRERFGIEFKKSTRQVFACRASLELSQLLDQPLGAPLLVLRGETHTADGQFSEKFTTYHVGDEVIFDLEVDLGK